MEPRKNALSAGLKAQARRNEEEIITEKNTIDTQESFMQEKWRNGKAKDYVPDVAENVMTKDLKLVADAEENRENKREKTI